MKTNHHHTIFTTGHFQKLGFLRVQPAQLVVARVEKNRLTAFHAFQMNLLLVSSYRLAGQTPQGQAFHSPVLAGHPVDARESQCDDNPQSPLKLRILFSSGEMPTGQELSHPHTLAGSATIRGKGVELRCWDHASSRMMRLFTMTQDLVRFSSVKPAPMSRECPCMKLHSPNARISQLDALSANLVADTARVCGCDSS